MIKTSNIATSVTNLSQLKQIINIGLPTSLLQEIF